MDKETFLKLLCERVKTPLHDWVIEEMACFLEKRGWVIMEKHLGGEHGPDILAASPSGKHFIFESEIEHASGRTFARNKLRMIVKYNKKTRVEKIVFIGLPKHELKFKEVCEEEKVSFQSQTISPEQFLKIDNEKLDAIINKIAK